MKKIYVDMPRFSDSIDLTFADKDGSGNQYVAEPLTLRPVDKNMAIDRPTAQLTRAEAQELIDGLWQCGLRPSEGSGSAGALAATQRHLDDMRTLVFDKK
jgi:hypothetical protein